MAARMREMREQEKWSEAWVWYWQKKKTHNMDDYEFLAVAHRTDENAYYKMNECNFGVV